MPRLSLKKCVENALRETVLSRMRLRLFRKFAIKRGLDKNSSPQDSLEDTLDEIFQTSLQRCETERYLFRPTKYRKSTAHRFRDDLDEQESVASNDAEADAGGEQQEDDSQPWLNDTEFLQKYRVSRCAFDYILDLIKDDPIFVKPVRPNNKKTGGQKQAPVAYQLMVFLHYIGTEGSGASNPSQRNVFGIGRGTTQLYRDRVAEAICKLSDRFLKWPDAEERAKIAKRMLIEYGWPNCVAIADGTLMPLAMEPETEDAPDYSGRKYGFSLSVMVICDDRRRILYYLAGWPGSAHDNRIFRATKIARTPHNFFDDTQFLIGDSAFENDWFVVSAFKKPPGIELPRLHELFNEQMAKLRIVSEHTIGMLKGRFPWMRSIRMKIKEDRKSMVRILKYIEASVILHNLLLEFGEEDKDEWIDYDDFSDMDDAERAPYEDTSPLNRAVRTGARKDERRRQVLHYFEDWNPRFLKY